jgi:hypothetical protein
MCGKDAWDAGEGGSESRCRAGQRRMRMHEIEVLMLQQPAYGSDLSHHLNRSGPVPQHRQNVDGKAGVGITLLIGVGDADAQMHVVAYRSAGQKREDMPRCAAVVSILDDLQYARALTAPLQVAVADVHWNIRRACS